MLLKQRNGPHGMIKKEVKQVGKSLPFMVRKFLFWIFHNAVGCCVSFILQSRGKRDALEKKASEMLYAT